MAVSTESVAILGVSSRQGDDVRSQMALKNVPAEESKYEDLKQGADSGNMNYSSYLALSCLLCDFRVRGDTLFNPARTLHPIREGTC